MKMKRNIIAMAITMAFVLGISSPAFARDAQGAYNADPFQKDKSTKQPSKADHKDKSEKKPPKAHKHKWRVESRRAFPDDPQCCAEQPSPLGIYSIEVPIPPQSEGEIEKLLQSLRSNRKVVQFAER